MLIAMMGNTYQKIAETRNEWQRQVCNIRTMFEFDSTNECKSVLINILNNNRLY